MAKKKIEDINKTADELVVKKSTTIRNPIVKKPRVKKDDSIPKDVKFKWDVTTKQILEDNKNEDAFFDPNLSYEITGYIPINETSGLDFDPAPFVATGLDKLNNGVYFEAKPGTRAYADFWEEQELRIKKGYTYGKYRITGDHYFFLNFHPLLSAANVSQSGAGRESSLPSFWVEHYKYFHYLELAEKLRRDVCLLKSRGVNKPALL